MTRFDENPEVYGDDWWLGSSLDTPLRFEKGKEKGLTFSSQRKGKATLSEIFSHETPTGKTKLGPLSPGLFLISHQGGPSTTYALECLQQERLGSPSPSLLALNYSIFISDEGMLYPPALQKWQLPLSRFLLVKTANSLQAWKTALEALQSGLFRWLFLRTSSAINFVQRRKLQLESEKAKTAVFLYS